MNDATPTGRYLVAASALFNLELVVEADSPEDALRKAAEMRHYTTEPGFTGWLIQDTVKGGLSLKWAEPTWRFE